jgi:hypothetical protein
MTLQGTGDVERWFEVALLNGVGIADELPVGTLVTLPPAAGNKQSIAVRLQVWNNRPASDGDNNELPTGIGFMQIGNDFVVS